jgi:hypothetical protein
VKILQLTSYFCVKCSFKGFCNNETIKNKKP